MTDAVAECDKDVPRTLWGQQVHAAALTLRARLDLLPADDEITVNDRRVLVEVRDLLTRAEALALCRPPRSLRRRLHQWWTGTRIEACWSYLYSAEIHLAQIDDEAVWQATARSALGHAHRLPVDDPDRVALTELAVRRFVWDPS